MLPHATGIFIFKGVCNGVSLSAQTRVKQVSDVERVLNLNALHLDSTQGQGLPALD